MPFATAWGRAVVALAIDGACRDRFTALEGRAAAPRSGATSDPDSGPLAALWSILDRPRVLRERNRALVGDPTGAASEGSAAATGRRLDELDGTLRTGAADPNAAAVILDDVVDRRDVAAALLDRLPEGTM